MGGPRSSRMTGGRGRAPGPGWSGGTGRDMRQRSLVGPLRRYVPAMWTPGAPCPGHPGRAGPSGDERERVDRTRLRRHRPQAAPDSRVVAISASAQTVMIFIVVKFETRPDWTRRWPGLVERFTA